MTTLTFMTALAVAAAGRVELDVRLEPGFNTGDVQRWNAMLGQAGFDSVRLGGNAAKPGPAIEPFTGIGGASYKVYGVLTRGGQLAVPQARFGLGDRAALATWVAKLRASGPPLAPGEKPPPFGLPPEMLDAVRRDLARFADFQTQGRTPTEVVNDLANRLGYPVTADATIAEQLGRGEKVPGELKGLSCGTIAAAVLRREGLSFVPATAKSGGVEYRVVRAAAGQDVWPVGWPPERPIPELLPDLFTLRNVKIDGYKASDLLQVVADRLKLPMLFDEQALVLKKLDPSKVVVNIPEGQLGYEAVLDRALFQASLKHEVRVDDAGRPFLWITSRQP
jgi:hypothetical protein